MEVTSSTQTCDASEILKSFECPVCYEYAMPPIHQCVGGHIVCSKCRPKLTCCPTCRGRLGNIRNRAMENVASTVSFPCKYSTSGCSVALLPKDKGEHEVACEFRPIPCPFPGVRSSVKAGAHYVEVVMSEALSEVNRDLPAGGSGQSNVADCFVCPVCFDYVQLPILQCQRGHIVCSICRLKLSNCPTCRGPLASIRNLAMEQVAETTLFPCKFHEHGCTVALVPKSKGQREEACEFTPFTCPYPGASCNWQGSLDSSVKPGAHCLKVVFPEALSEDNGEILCLDVETGSLTGGLNN